MSRKLLRHRDGRQRMALRAPFQRALYVAVPLGLMALTAGAPSANAVDINSNSAIDGLYTQTVSRAEQLRDWDVFAPDGTRPVRPEPEPEYGLMPYGLPFGNFRVYPEAGAALVYDDNIYGSDRSKTGDFRTELTPAVRLRSELPRHVLDLSLDGKIVNYLDNPDLNYANYRARADAALHFDSSHTISLSASSLLAHDEPGDPLFELTAAEPISHFEHSAAIGITRDAGRLYGTVAAGYLRRDYSDVRSTLGGSKIDQDLRDTDTWIGEFRAGYRISPGFDLVGKFRTSRIFNDGNGIAPRDAWSYEALAGLAFEANPLLKWRILAGYGVRDYDHKTLENLSSTLLQADVQWSPTRRLTIYGALYRQLEEEFDSVSQGIIRQGARVKGEYEITHNLFLTGSLEYREDDFRGIARQDDVYEAGVGLKYYLNNNWLFTFGYQHQVRDSTDDLRDMHRNRFMVGAKLRF